MSVSILLALTVLLGGSHLVDSRAAKPHILFVLADDYGWNDIGYHGSEIPTPYLDKLAASGIKLENYYVQLVCTPSRASLMTGRYPIRYGLQHGVIQAPQAAGLFLNETTLADKMRESGYATHAIGKWHLGFFEWKYTPTYRGFDTHVGYYAGGQDYFTHISNWQYAGYDFRNGTEPLTEALGTYSSTVFEYEAERIVSNYARDTSPDKKPIFMYLAMQTCHIPLEVPSQYEQQCGHIKDRARKIFCGMTINLDGTIGNITQAFQQAGIWEDTLVVFSTDNGGWPLGGGGSNWPLRGGKFTLWEGGVRGVGFVRGAGIPQDLVGSKNNALMHMVDWFPTLIRVAGGNTSGTFPLDGVDQWDAITKDAPSARTEILHNIDGDVAALRSGDLKVVIGNQSYDGWYDYNATTSFGANTISKLDAKPTYLFNITEDPNERQDISGQYPNKLKELLARIEEYRAGLVKAWSPPDDPASDPALFNGMWTPWVDSTA